MKILTFNTSKAIAFALMASSGLLTVGSVYAVANNTDEIHNKPHQMERSKYQRGSEQNRINKMVEKLALSEQQQEKIEVIMQNTRDESNVLQQEMKQYKEQVKGLIEAETFDQQAFLSLRNEYHTTFTSFALAKAMTKHAMLTVLTAEQKEQWLQAKKGKRQRR